MNVERLQTLSHHLRNNVSPNDFRMKSWSHCALGHACNIEEFRQAGLCFVGGYAWIRDNGTPVAGGFGAGQLLFDINYSTSMQLFGSNDRTPAEAADAIDCVVRIELEKRRYLAEMEKIEIARQASRDVAAVVELAKEDVLEEVTA